MVLGRLFVVAVLCWGAVAAAPAPRDDVLNSYIDMVMDNLQVLIVEQGLDPADLPGASTGFSDTVLGITWHGEAEVYDGWLKGLSSIHRTDNSEFLYDGDSSVIGMETGLGLDTMNGHYKLRAQFMNLGPKADVTLKVHGASISFGAALDKAKCRFHVSKMEVTKIGRISIDVHGLGPLNWILELVVDMVANVVRLFIKGTIEDIVSGIANDALDDLDLGALGPIVGCEDPAASLKVVYEPRKLITQN